MANVSIPYTFRPGTTILSAEANANFNELANAVNLLAAGSGVSKSGDTMTGPLVLPLGTVSAVALAATGGLGCGLYFPSTSIVALATAGTERLRTSAAGTQLAGTLGLEGNAPPTHGILIASGTAADPTNVLENRSGSLYFNDVALATGASVSGTLNYIPKFTGASSLGNSSFYESGGKLVGNVQGNLTGNADTVTNGVYTTGSYANPSWITSLAAAKIAAGTAGIDISGNAATATYATSAGSVSAIAWTSVTGRPTAVSQFTNDSGFIPSTISAGPSYAVSGNVTGLNDIKANYHYLMANNDTTDHLLPLVLDGDGRIRRKTNCVADGGTTLMVDGGGTVAITIKNGLITGFTITP